MRELGQLFITGIEGTSLTSEEAEFIEQENIGGVIIFAHNYEDPAQLAELINDIQKLRDEYPLFICIDHEGGRVHRFKNDKFTHFPSMGELAKLKSPKTIFEVYKAMAEELNACGINLSFAPVCDILTNPDNKVIGDRSFGSDPTEVEKFVSAAIRGLQTTNILSCAKHFPGHGGTTKDSHFDLPLVKTDLDTIKSRELIPFVKASKSRVEFVMMAHLMIDSLNDELPTTLSSEAYSFLREELKFKKIIISDDMNMKAITDRFTFEEAAVKAFEAGVDILEYRDFESTVKAYNAVKDALASGRLDRKQVEAKTKRVKSCKKNFLSEYKPIYIPNISKNMKLGEHKVLLEGILEKLSS